MVSLAGMALAGLLLTGGGAPRTVLAMCPNVSIGIDTSRADVVSGVIFGEGLIQTFVAPDSMLRSITIWRPAAEDSLVFYHRLWIMPIGSNGFWLSDSAIFRSPDLLGPYGDGIHPTPIVYAFDPPLRLPGIGSYAFAIQNLCAGTTDLLADTLDDYPDGRHWQSQRSSFSGCILSGARELPPNADLVFTFEFCDTNTPVKRRSWGEVKMLYR